MRKRYKPTENNVGQKGVSVGVHLHWDFDPYIEWSYHAIYIAQMANSINIKQLDNSIVNLVVRKTSIL